MGFISQLAIDSDSVRGRGTQPQKASRQVIKKSFIFEMNQPESRQDPGVEGVKFFFLRS